MDSMRPELPELPKTMKELPVVRGFPVPWFVQWINGEPEFRVMDHGKLTEAINNNRCWVCGVQFTNRRRAFVIGPMCAVNRISAEPPCHPECAQFAVMGCPFLSKPKMHRREVDLPEGVVVAEGHIERNPGVTLIWYCRTWHPFPVDGGLLLIDLGDPENWQWYREGRLATREEILESIDSGVTRLMETAENDEERAYVKEKVEWVLQHMVPMQ